MTKAPIKAAFLVLPSVRLRLSACLASGRVSQYEPRPGSPKSSSCPRTHTHTLTHKGVSKRNCSGFSRSVKEADSWSPSNLWKLRHYCERVLGKFRSDLTGGSGWSSPKIRRVSSRVQAPELMVSPLGTLGRPEGGPQPQVEPQERGVGSRTLDKIKIRCGSELLQTPYRTE